MFFSWWLSLFNQKRKRIQISKKALQRTNKNNNTSSHMHILEADVFGVYRPCLKTWKVSRKWSLAIREALCKIRNIRRSKKEKLVMRKSSGLLMIQRSSHLRVSLSTIVELLFIFMHAHDPTTYHRQGIDSGSQYRSVVYYQTED